MEDLVYITGHQHPDTDSVVSAIAYAFFKRTMGVRAVACRLGPLNKETKWLLDRFGFEEPMLFKDARKTMAEIDIDPPTKISPDTTIHEAIVQMQADERAALGVCDDNGVLLGMVTKTDLTRFGFGDTAMGIELLRQTPVEDICKTISGQLLFNPELTHLNGKVSIVALTKDRVENYEIKDRIVIIGDDDEAQLRLIQKGAGMLILVWSKGVSDAVLEAARKAQCAIIISGHGSMNTSRYIYFAPPVKLVMSTKLITFNTHELAEDVGRKLMTSRYRVYPVVDDERHLVGYVARYHILNYHNKKVILVDHNEFSQSVKAVEKAELLEVVDHHRINDFATQSPVSFRNEIVGSTATIIATMFRENQIPLPKNLAGLLLGAVLSDTLMFQSPTTTEKDKATANMLAAFADLDIDSFGREMFSVQGNLENTSMQEAIVQDIKYYNMHGLQVMIGQVSCNDLAGLKEREAEIQSAMDRLCLSKHLDILVIAFTSIVEQASVFYYAGDKAEWAGAAFKQSVPVKGILSRKSQILPAVSEAVDRFA